MRERGAMEILEEAVHLLRSADSSTAAVYLAGAVPFFTGLLYFWTDMARNPFAAERLFPESLVIAALFVWKSVWQALFEARLYRRLSLSPEAPVHWRRLIATQAAYQPLSLLAIPVSFLVAFPFGWSVAFFRAVGLFAALGHSRPVASASRQARLWSKQNWIVLSLMALAGVLLLANVLIAIVMLPQFGRSFLGIEGDFARLGMGILNFTTFAVAGSIAWLAIDPLLDAVYVIRCFRGESLATGEDLAVAFKRAVISASAALVLLIACSPAALGQTPAQNPASGVAAEKQSAAPKANAATVDPARLDQAILEVLRQREFAWRVARAPGAEPEGRWVGWVRTTLNYINRGFEWLAGKLRDWFRSKPDTDEGPKTSGDRPPLELWMGLAVVVSAGAAVAQFLARGNRTAIKTKPVAAAPVAVDLTDESITADQLPESSWLKLAEELLGKGDCRLALRALYLAGLNYLGERELVSIRRWKTGRDYRVELERRSRARAISNIELMLLFTRNVGVFERGWYGRHLIERAEVEAFASGLEEIKRYAGGA